MPDTLEKRVTDLETMIAHLPGDLDVRFAGLQAAMGHRFDQLVLQGRTHDHKFDAVAQANSVIEARLAKVERALGEISSKLDTLLRG